MIDEEKPFKVGEVTHAFSVGCISLAPKSEF